MSKNCYIPIFINDFKNLKDPILLNELKNMYTGVVSENEYSHVKNIAKNILMFENF